MENAESQEMEILALQNIFDQQDFVVDSMEPPSGCFKANVRLPEDFKIAYQLPRTDLGIEENYNFDKTFLVEHLPPINLFFHFPKSYPLNTCPAFLLSCNWLTLEQLSLLCRHLESLWEECHDAILYTWCQFLQDESLNFRGVSEYLDVTVLLKFKARNFFQTVGDLDQSDTASSNSEMSVQKQISRSIIGPAVNGGQGAVDNRAFNDMADGRTLVQNLKKFNEKKKQDVFLNLSHVCEICFLTKIGSEFVTFRPCGHFFCEECVKSYFEVQIKDGNVSALNCPGDKCETQADGSIVRQVVSSELYEKYDKLLLARTLEGMPDITYCPRLDCQCPVLLETCGKMGSCLKCGFAFCALCNAAYHGVAACNFKKEQTQAIFKLYNEADDVGKSKIEKQYGRRAVKQLVENIMSEDWTNSNCKQCPQCKASIEKTEGCNKMTCYKCGTYFCWLCNKRLQSSNPYTHFNDRNGDCELFNFEDIENGEFMIDVEPGEFLNFYF